MSVPARKLAKGLSDLFRVQYRSAIEVRQMQSNDVGDLSQGQALLMRTIFLITALASRLALEGVSFARSRRLSDQTYR